MRVSAYHHIALRVREIERAVRFYLEAFGGRLLTSPFVLEGPLPEEVFSGPPGLRAKVCFVGFEEGVVELFEFDPSPPVPRSDQTADGLIHFAFRVDDVPEALRRVEAAGGRARFPVKPWGDRHFVYCEDPDGHVFELLDMTLEETLERTIEAMPEAAPPASR